MLCRFRDDWNAASLEVDRLKRELAEAEFRIQSLTKDKTTLTSDMDKVWSGLVWFVCSLVCQRQPDCDVETLDLCLFPLIVP